MVSSRRGQLPFADGHGTTARRKHSADGVKSKWRKCEYGRGKKPHLKDRELMPGLTGPPARR